MSRHSNRGDDCAPALFPFLAVLLCTIGALVLILVVSVVHSHASAKRDMSHELEDRVEQAKEQSDYLQSISDELAARRERVKREIDRRRKELANVEDHIARLRVQIDQLRAQFESIESDQERDQQSRTSKQDRIDQLKEQIDAKRQELAEELQRLKNRKPAFSIIPYDGPNGTSRRPVYLECRADGVILQPEGIRITLQDLRPPYGKGNPLDAALRVLRTAYQQRDATFGLNIPPYPLLIVRPDGIHSYAMARAAMSGWDDQFGYELIEADMSLVFPPGIPSLKQDLQLALDTARQRQESAIASLPRPLARAREFDDVDWESITPDSYRNEPQTAPGDDSAIGDGRNWEMLQPMDSSASPNAFATPSGSNASSRSDLPLQFPSGNGSSPGPQGDATADPETLAIPGSDRSRTDPSRAAPSAPNRGANSTGGAFATNAHRSAADGDAGNPAGDPGAVGSLGGDGSGNATSAQGSSTPGNTAGSPMPQRANAFSFPSAMGNSNRSMGNSDASDIPQSEAMADAIREMQNKPSNAAQPTSDQSNSAQTNSPSTNNRNRFDDDASKPIASSRGKGWALPGKDPKATPVTRPIRIVVLDDRWMVRKEGSESRFDAEIELAAGPQQAGSLLEKTIRNRVESWGPSLPGGYWSPSITIEAANDADRSVRRLQQMLDGSGVELHVLPLQAPASKPPESKPPASKATAVPGLPSRR